MADALTVPEVWHLRPGDTGLRWFARRQPDGIAGGVIKSHQGTYRLLRNLNGRADLYWGINQSDRTTGVRVSAKDITHWNTVLLDIDPVEPDSNPLEAAKYFIDRAMSVLNQPLDPTIIFSGRGAQVILSLEPQALADDDARRRVRVAVGAFQRAVGCGTGSAPHTLAYGCVVDTSCSDLARVARMPDTVNLKTGVASKLIRRGLKTHTRLSEGILALADRVEREVSPPSVTYPWQAVWSQLTRKAQAFLAEGVASPGRHVAAYACARSLRDRGVSEREATGVIAQGAFLCRPPLPICEAHRIVTCAYT